MRIAFHSTIVPSEPWAGCEELWARAALVLCRQGHEVHIRCSPAQRGAARIQDLVGAGAKVSFGRAAFSKSFRRTVRRKLGVELSSNVYWLRRTRPEFLLITATHHLDDFRDLAGECVRLGIPYAVLLQAAGPYHWIDERKYRSFRKAYVNACRCFFVSDQNRRTIEANLATTLDRAEVVDNPFNVSPAAAPDWPTPDGLWKLAYVGRLDFISKSQDLVLEVLRQPKWRARPLEVSLWGADNGSGSRIREIIEQQALEQRVVIGGYTNDIAELWSRHHGLLLPSRYEGHALALNEAMLCGRVPIVTNVGRAAELIDDNVTGFIAPAATVELIEDAMERAWVRREQWREMGAKAAVAIRQRHSLTPAEDFARRLVDLSAGVQAPQRLAA